MTGSLYILRHGRTDWNAIKKLQGQVDIPLNDEGRAMAKEAADKYRDVRFDICFCSPLVRAVETAKILLSGRNVPVEYDDRLKEISFGDNEGLEYPKLPEGHCIRTFFLDPAGYVPAAGGESVDDLIKRTASFLDERVYPLIDEGKSVLIVGHGAMNSSIILNVKHLPVNRLWDEGIENCLLKQLI